MPLNRLALPSALGLLAVSQAATAAPRCQPAPAVPGGQPSEMQDRLAASRLDPGPAPVQALLAALSAGIATDCRYAAANAAQQQAGRPLAVLIGDSITENWIKFDPAFFSDGFVDRGISGETSAQILLRFTADVVALRPAVVHIMAGTNDIAENAGPVSDEYIENNIAAMVDLAQANGIRVVLASIPPAKAFPWSRALRPAARIEALNRWLRDYAVRRGIGYVDYYKLLAEPDGGMRTAYSGDGVHPNQAGYAAVATTARDAIAQARR